MINLIKSVTTLLIVGSAISFPFASSLNGFLKGLIVCIIIQIVLYNVYRGFQNILIEKFRNDRENQLAKRGTYVTCPCHLEKRDFIPISFDKDNSYTCMHCTKRVAVACNVKTYLTTEPLPLEGTAEALLQEATKSILQKK